MIMIRKFNRDKCCLIMLVCWLILIWVCTFVGDANGSSMYIFSALLGGVICVAFTIGWNRAIIWNYDIKLFYPEDSPAINIDEDDYKPGLRISLLLVLLLSTACYVGIIATGWGNWIDLFDGRIIPKYFLNVLMLVAFPSWATYIIRQVKDSYAFEAVLSGYVQIVALSFLGYLLFMKGPYIWLVYLATLNILSVLLAIKKYLWKSTNNKKAIVTSLLLYIFIWMIFLSISWDKTWTVTYVVGFDSYLQFTRYKYAIREILCNASIWGQSSTLLKDPYVLQFLYYSHWILPSVLTYSGWVSGILVMAAEGLLLISAAEIVKKSKLPDGRDVILDIVWIGLLIRVVGGFLLSFGIPVPVSLPFSNAGSIMADSIYIGILVMAFWGNKYQEYLNRKKDKNRIDEMELLEIFFGENNNVHRE
jgi:hypothetical protein